MVYSGKESEKECVYLNMNRYGVAQMVKNLPAVWETRVQSLGWDNPLEKEMATHSSIHDWRIPLQYSCLEKSMNREPGRGQFMGLQRVRHD